MCHEMSASRPRRRAGCPAALSQSSELSETPRERRPLVGSHRRAPARGCRVAASPVFSHLGYGSRSSGCIQPLIRISSLRSLLGVCAELDAWSLERPQQQPLQSAECGVRSPVQVEVRSSGRGQGSHLRSYAPAAPGFELSLRRSLGSAIQGRRVLIGETTAAQGHRIQRCW